MWFILRYLAFLLFLKDAYLSTTSLSDQAEKFNSHLQLHTIIISVSRSPLYDKRLAWP